MARRDLNKIIAMGNVGQVRCKDWGDGTASLSFGLALNDEWTDRDGNKREHTEWLNCVVTGKRGKSLAPYVVKGTRLYVEGYLRTREADDGRKFTECIVRDLMFQSSGKTGEPQRDGTREMLDQHTATAADDDDDIPF